MLEEHVPPVMRYAGRGQDRGRKWDGTKRLDRVDVELWWNIGVSMGLKTSRASDLLV